MNDLFYKNMKTRTKILGKRNKPSNNIYNYCYKTSHDVLLK